MAKRTTSPVDQQVIDLSALAERVEGEELEAALRTALAAKPNLVVAKAAEIVGQRGLAQFQEDLEAAFKRFLAEPLKTDKACAGKTAIARTLQTLGLPAEATYLAGVRHVQMEPVWGGEADTAAELRGLCAQGLVQMKYPRVMLILTDLLADASPDTRIGAVRALGATADDAAVLLLRYKLHLGDAQPNVIAECLRAMMRLSPAEGAAFVSLFLSNADNAIAEAAAAALGESGSQEALTVLMTYYREGLARASRRVVLHAVAAIGTPEAVDALLRIAQDDDVPSAVHAIEALRAGRPAPETLMRLQAIARSRGEPALTEAVSHVDAKR